MAEHAPIMNPTPDNPDWAGLAHAPADSASLAALAGAAPEAMTGPALLDAIVASEKALSFLAAKQMRLLTAFAQPFKAGDPMRLARRLARRNCITGDDDPDQVAMYVEEAARSLAQAEVAAALRIPSKTAGNRVQEAATMTGVLAPTLAALETGVLDRGKARVIAEHCAPLIPGEHRQGAGPGAAHRGGPDHQRTAGGHRAGGDHRRPRRRAGTAPGRRRPQGTRVAGPAGCHGVAQGVPARGRCGEDLPGLRPAGHRHRRHPG